MLLIEDGGGGKDYSSLRSSPFGSLPAATLSRCARIEPWSKLLILPRPEKKWNLNVKICGVLSESDGGGGRIRTFEVDDGRFTVCSLWPLGNPTGLDGADYRNRTGDLLITSQLLYLLI